MPLDMLSKLFYKLLLCFENICSFLYSKIKQTLHFLLLGFPISPSLVTTSLKDFPLVSVWKKSEWMGNKDFFLATKQYFLFSVNNLHSLSANNLIYTFVNVPDIKLETVDWKFSPKKQSQPSFTWSIKRK